MPTKEDFVWLFSVLFLVALGSVFIMTGFWGTTTAIGVASHLLTLLGAMMIFLASRL